jgi:hypothetical protein
MAERDRPHILIRGGAEPEPYTRPPGGGDGGPLARPANPGAHAASLIAQLTEGEDTATALRDELADDLPRADGIFITFESFPEVDLALQSLDPQLGQRHPELVAVRSVKTPEGICQQATVFIPDGKLGYFLDRLQAYADTVDEPNPKNRNLIDRIASIGVAALEQLWTDPPDDFPEPEAEVWWELWLRRRDGQEPERVRHFADAISAQLGAQMLAFPDRTVMLIRTSAARLSDALAVLDDLAEVRKPAVPGALLSLEPPTEQHDWVQDLAGRTAPATGDAPAVAVLDTGASREHPLLDRSLAAPDCHASDSAWGVNDHDGHGTEMAGLALYGNLDDAIVSGGAIHLTHRLESVKIWPPPPGQTPPHLYGAVTATAASVVEIQAPDRRRVFSLATTADWDTVSADADRQLGQPTSWSASIDALAAGLEIDVDDDGLLYLNEEQLAGRRLFLISAGNVRDLEDDHLARSDVEPIEDPAQAWNALTIRAHTELTDASSGPGFTGWTPLAPEGELSPFSRTAVAFERAWPHKPDVVLEGGNAARSPSGTDFDTPETLQLLTTNALSGQSQRLLTVTHATSAATAQASFLAGSILAENPTLWPETVRALIVHSAEWTAAMRGRFDGAPTRAQKRALFRRYGMGVPDLRRATRSATDALTLIAEDVIHPFDGNGHTREMHLHALPWPTDELANLGDVEARLRITLSYFIEPNPARRGWARRYSYASHGLRFAVRQPTETTEDFRKRINKQARAEDEGAPGIDSDANEWFFGPDLRTVGSLHTDIWRGTAADLADRGVIGVFPVGGWWKERKDRDHSDRGARYALIASIGTPDQTVDLWTPVAQQVGIQIEIDT